MSERARIVTTRYLPATKTRPGRHVATCGDKSGLLSVPPDVDGGLPSHEYVAKKLIRHLNETTFRLPVNEEPAYHDNTKAGYAFVFTLGSEG